MRSTVARQSSKTPFGEAQRPSDWVANHLPSASPGATLLDVACGAGRHTRLALARSYRVTAVDRDISGLADLIARADVTAIAADLEAGNVPPFVGRRFDIVIVTNYLWRPVFQHVVDAVAPTGLLIYETFGIGHEAFGRPTNPDFLLEPGELLRRCAPHGNFEGLIPVAFEHGLVRSSNRDGRSVTCAADQASDRGSSRIVQRIVASGRHRVTPHLLPSIRQETGV